MNVDLILDMSRKYMFNLLCVLLAHVIEQGRSRPCISEDTSYICRDISRIDDFPSALPNFVDKVTLIGTGELGGSFPNGRFHDRIWENVSELTILKFENIEEIEKAFLDGLRHLRYLSISEVNPLRYIDPEVFQSTPNLVALHFDWDSNLELSVIEKALEGKVNKLKYLSLKGLAMDHPTPGILGERFFNALIGKNLTYLDVSSANIAGIIVDSKNDAFSHFLYLDVSHSKLALPGILHKVNANASSLKLEMIDGSGCLSIMQNVREQTVNKMDCYVPDRLKYAFFEEIVKPDIRIEFDAEAHFNQCIRDHIEIVDLSKNRLSRLNVTVTGSYSFRGLVKLNLSMNDMEYISPSLLGTFPSLKILDLSENQLHKMQNMDDFSNLLRGNSELQILLLGKNHLSLIPNNFFSSNKLKLLDLKENDLIHFSMEFSHMQNLKFIDLSKNRLNDLPFTLYNTLEEVYTCQVKEKETNISFFNDNSLLQSLDRNTISQRYRYGYNPNVTLNLLDKWNVIPHYVSIDLSDNPIECKCESLSFLTWFVSTKIKFVNRKTLVCKYGNAIYPLDNKTLEKVEFDCQLPSTIMKAILPTVLVILCSCAMAFLVYRIRRNKRNMEDIEILKHFINQDDVHFNYVAFIPYCSIDSDLVEENILTALRNGIMEKLNTDNDVLCTGAEHFMPGMLIINEIHRCINESLVVVPIITPAFVQSPWSQKECVVAIERHRKVVVLMQEQTNISQAERAIQNLIAHYTIATWSNRDGPLTIRPSWNIICDRIISLAAETLRNQRQQRDNQADDLNPIIEEDTL